MNIAVPREVHEGETRVSMIPENVAKLVKAGDNPQVSMLAWRTLGAARPDFQFVRHMLRFVHVCHFEMYITLR